MSKVDVEQELKNYIRNWNTIKGVKPENESVFISLFTDWLFEKDGDLEFEFQGEGSYFGKQISINKTAYFNYTDLNFEIAYDKDHIRIYTGNHNGFWVPEYVDITSENDHFAYLQNALMDFIKLKVGIE